MCDSGLALPGLPKQYMMDIILKPVNQDYSSFIVLLMTKQIQGSHFSADLKFHVFSRLF